MVRNDDLERATAVLAAIVECELGLCAAPQAALAQSARTERS
jgi:hypothetical protein